MPFFVPERLLEFEYFETKTKNDEEAKQYSDVIDFAFFVVNFGYSRSDYNALTPLEKAFILKEYEKKTVEATTNMRNAVQNAVSNVLKKKGKRAQPLWKKKIKKSNPDEVRENLEIIKQSEKSDGNWIERLYRENNIIKGKAGGN